MISRPHRSSAPENINTHHETEAVGGRFHPLDMGEECVCLCVRL